MLFLFFGNGKGGLIEKDFSRELGYWMYMFFVILYCVFEGIKFEVVI